MSITAPENTESRPTLPSDAPRARLSATTAGGVTTCDTDRPVLLIGSRRDCDLPLSHPDVSKVHCAVVNTGREIIVRDLLSRSGTFINQQAIRSAVLKPGDVLRAGPAELGVTFVDAGAPRASPSTQAVSLVLEVAGVPIEIGRNVAVIGRREGADVLMDHPDVSLAHAVLFAVDGRPVVCDLGSRSGTLVSGRRVDLAWLSDGDELGIGSETLTVRWKPVQAVTAAPPENATESVPQPALAPAQAAPPSPAEPRPEPVAARAPVAADLGDLEQTIVAVQAQISSARLRLDERQRGLDQREVEFNRRVAESVQAQAALDQRRAELEARGAQLDEQRKGLESEQSALAAQRTQVEETRAGLEKERQELNEAAQTAQQQAGELRQRETQLTDATGQLAQERQRLVAERAELDARLAGHAQEFAELERRTGALAARDAALTAREQELSGKDAALAAQEQELSGKDAALIAREQELSGKDAALAAREQELSRQEAALRERESREGAAVAKIEHFRSVLQQASTLFSTAAPPQKSGPGDPPATPPASRSSSTAASPAAPASPAQAAGQVAEAGGDGLPAPMVDRPIFAADASIPPREWPLKLRERFRVLRRVSTKTNEELLAQVWAERDRAQARADAAPPVRKRRFRWGN